MKELLDEPIDIKNKTNAVVPTDFSGEVEFKDVSFTYPRKDESVIDAMNLKIKPQQMVALVGKSGEGKSTIFKLLCRMYDIKDGQVLLDGKDIQDLDLHWYRKQFAIVQQDVDIFDASIAENIRYAAPEVGDEQVIEAINAACLDIFLNDENRFPDGIKTEVGERGVRLSGGEKQRVGIARAYLALLNGAKILVLDEATSSLDSQSERAIQDMIANLREKQSVTIIACAHRLSTIKHSDMIYVIGKGKVIEQGNHTRLLKRNGLYSKLVKLQQIGELRE